MSFTWHDPAQLIEDASWVKVTREALAMERKAWEAAHADRLRLQTRVRELETTAAVNIVITAEADMAELIAAGGRLTIVAKPIAPEPLPPTPAESEGSEA